MDSEPKEQPSRPTPEFPSEIRPLGYVDLTGLQHSYRYRKFARGLTWDHTSSQVAKFYLETRQLPPAKTTVRESENSNKTLIKNVVKAVLKDGIDFMSDMHPEVIAYIDKNVFPVPKKSVYDRPYWDKQYFHEVGIEDISKSIDGFIEAQDDKTQYADQGPDQKRAVVLERRDLNLNAAPLLKSHGRALSLLLGKMQVDGESVQDMQDLKEIFTQEQINGLSVLIDQMVGKGYVQELKAQGFTDSQMEEYFANAAAWNLAIALGKTAGGSTKHLNLYPPFSLNSRLNLAYDSRTDLSYLPYMVRVYTEYASELPNLVAEGGVYPGGELERVSKLLQDLCKTRIKEEMGGKTAEQIKSEDPEKFADIQRVLQEVNQGFFSLTDVLKAYRQSPGLLNKQVGISSAGRFPSVARFREKLRRYGAKSPRVPLDHK